MNAREFDSIKFLSTHDNPESHSLICAMLSSGGTIMVKLWIKAGDDY